MNRDTKGKKQLPGISEVDLGPIFHFHPDSPGDARLLLLRNRWERLCGWRDGWLGVDGDAASLLSGSTVSVDKDNSQIFRWFVWSVWKSGGGLSGTWASGNNIFGCGGLSRVLSGSLRESHLDPAVFLSVKLLHNWRRKGNRPWKHRGKVRSCEHTYENPLASVFGRGDLVQLAVREEKEPTPLRVNKRSLVIDAPRIGSVY